MPQQIWPELCAHSSFMRPRNLQKSSPRLLIYLVFATGAITHHKWTMVISTLWVKFDYCEKQHNTNDDLYIGESITLFMRFYKETFPDASITPKMHMMEKHVVPQTRLWKVGMGVLGEQGAESIHACFNGIEKSYAGIPNKKDRLLRVMQEHYLKIDPENLVLAPPPKKRSKKSH